MLKCIYINKGVDIFWNSVTCAHLTINSSKYSLPTLYCVLLNLIKYSPHSEIPRDYLKLLISLIFIWLLSEKVALDYFSWLLDFQYNRYASYKVSTMISLFLLNDSILLLSLYIYYLFKPRSKFDWNEMGCYFQLVMKICCVFLKTYY